MDIYGKFWKYLRETWKFMVNMKNRTNIDKSKRAPKTQILDLILPFVSQHHRTH